VGFRVDLLWIKKCRNGTGRTLICEDCNSSILVHKREQRIQAKASMDKVEFDDTASNTQCPVQKESTWNGW
jgi:uncharacterized protein YlaI